MTVAHFALAAGFGTTGLTTCVGGLLVRLTAGLSRGMASAGRGGRTGGDDPDPVVKN